ncbi:Endo-beta-1,4-glucanase B [Colletotrichum orbiculare MAFF 240422]|uniref:cellulase n=1 Tax=Colletotrichum orbiculare (strain 104-T / ATCC 96160 / CBS 514.97 / LARS 414 / MAFF 240422) TaxID=1213857 RepID=A0A484FLY7_COLOR|nr:Endo-beta-1,4-glucanase B [Colletotrichum orbiculare MAFF 240422]
MKGLIVSAAIVSAAIVGGAMAQAGSYMRCGGTGWTGETTCTSATTLQTSTIRASISSSVVVSSKSSVEVASSAKISPVTSVAAEAVYPTAATKLSTSIFIKPSTSAAVPTTTKAASTSVTSAAAASTSTTPAKTGKFKWFGSSQSGAEFGQANLPGVAGTDYTWPDEAKVTTLLAQGYNTLRLPFLMERLSHDSSTGAFNADYLAGLTKAVEHITSSGASAVLDPHNYGRYRNIIITDTASFKTFWSNLAKQFKSNEKVIFDTNNEYNSMDQDLVLQLNQAAVDGIRDAGATNWIWAEGNSWSGAHSWTSVNDNMKGLTDPLDKTVYEMHQYLDGDSSGTAADCTSATCGVDRVKDATAWLRANNKVGVLGEFAGGANEVCKEAVTNLLDYLQENSDVWQGAVWWAAGPMWGSYMYSFEPETGAGYDYYNDLLKKYL